MSTNVVWKSANLPATLHNFNKGLSRRVSTYHSESLGTL